MENKKPNNWEEYRKIFNFTKEEEEEIRIEKELIIAIAKARQEKGITQKKLSEISGVSQQAISRLENSSHSPQLDTIVKILTPLGYRLSITPIYIAVK